MMTVDDDITLTRSGALTIDGTVTPKTSQQRKGYNNIINCMWKIMNTEVYGYTAAENNERIYTAYDETQLHSVQGQCTVTL